MKLTKKPLALLIAAAAMTSSQAYAQWAIEEVVVTAQKRAQSMNDVGVAVSAFTGDQMKDLGLTDTASVAANTPGFQVTDAGGAGIPVYTIRGIGFDDISVNSSSTVGLYADEVAKPYPVMTKGIQFDLERIEVLKGPQGDLYGRNNTGGAVNLVNNKPSEEFEANITVDVGNYGLVKAEGFVNGSLSDAANGRLAFTSTKSDEWQKNEVDGSKNGAQDSYALRAQVDFQVNDDVSVLAMVHGSKDKSDPQVPQSTLIAPIANTYAQLYNYLSTLGTLYPATYPTYALLAQDHTYTANGLEDFKTQNPSDASSARWNLKPSRDADNLGAAITVNWDMENTTLTSITAYDKFERTEQNDWDGMDITSTHSQNQDKIESYSQELRLTSDGDNDLTWIGGLYYSFDEVDANTVNDIFQSPAALPYVGAIFGQPGFITSNQSHQETETRGVFGHAELQATDTIKLTGGLRYTWEERQISTCTFDVDGSLKAGLMDPLTVFGAWDLPAAPGAGNCTHIEFTDITTDPVTGIFPGAFNDTIRTEKLSGKVGVDFTPNDDWLIYASVGTSFKSGGFNVFSALSSEQFLPYKAEDLLAYEIGFKGSMLDSTMQLNGAVFKYDYRDKQVSELGPDASGVFPVLTFLNNIEKSEVNGAELELQWLPLEGLSLRSSATYLNSEIKQQSSPGFDGMAEVGMESFDATGKELPNTPKWSYNVMASYEFSVTDGLSLRTAADYNHQDESYSFTSNTAAVKVENYGVLNARITLFAEDDTWSASLWGKNLDKKSYNLSNSFATDGMVAFKGMKPTYGVSVSYNFL